MSTLAPETNSLATTTASVFNTAVQDSSLSSTFTPTQTSPITEVTNTTTSSLSQFNSTDKTITGGSDNMTRSSNTMDTTSSIPETSVSPFGNSSTVSQTADLTYDTTPVAGDFTTTGLFKNNTAAEKIVSGDCSTAIAITAAAAAVIWIATVVLFVFCLYKMRQQWRRKIHEERQRTDIWSMSTFHNTIINDNFMDYKLAPSPSSRKNRSSDARTAQVSKSRLSGGALSRTSSMYNDDYTFRQSLRRSTMSDDERFRFSRSKSRTKRQPSNYSADPWLESSSEFRGRTSTFNIGKGNKYDKHALVDHDQLHMSGSRSYDGIDRLEKHSVNPRPSSQEQPYHVTEL